MLKGVSVWQQSSGHTRLYDLLPAYLWRESGKFALFVMVFEQTRPM